jgi:hypothetical protein
MRVGSEAAERWQSLAWAGDEGGGLGENKAPLFAGECWRKCFLLVSHL